MNTDRQKPVLRQQAPVLGRKVSPDNNIEHHRFTRTPNMRAVKFVFLAFAVSIFVTFVHAQGAASPDRNRDNFMVVVRESIGVNRPDDALVPSGKFKAKLSDGKEIELEMASWEFIGDTHIRFVFDGPQMMINATPQDLARLEIKNVEEALALALKNIKRVYGEPRSKPWEGGLLQVQGKSPDLDSSYFLDREFWNGTLKQHPQGLVVAVPKRGGLVYAPATDEKAVDTLKRGIAYLHASSQRQRVSSALFLFKEGKWSVLQPPAKQ